MSFNKVRYTKRKSLHAPAYEHEWFFRLRPNEKDTGLEGYYNAKLLEKGIIMARDVKGKWKSHKRFGYFKSREQVLEHMNKYPSDKWHFYELVGGTTRQQKIYFDLDINPYNLYQFGVLLEKEAENLMLKTVREIAQKLKSLYDVDLKPGDVSIYQTVYPNIHKVGTPDEKGTQMIPDKYSYHIVIQGNYFS